MEMDKLLVEMEDNVMNYNGVKDVVISRLLMDNIISEEQAKTYSEKWNIIIIKPNWFKRWCNVFSQNEGEWILKYVKFED